MRRRLYLCAPIAQTLVPVFGYVDLHDAKVIETAIRLEHLDEWVKALEALRIELALKTALQGSEGGAGEA